MKTLIVVPTYNEAENIEALLRAVLGTPLPDPVDVLVVDDNSPDGTAGVVRRLMAAYPQRLFLLGRAAKEGLGKAYTAGFSWGLERSYEAFCEMDADFSHDPKYLAPILRQIHHYDFVVASRYVPGGGVSGWGPVRRLLSLGGSLYARTILGCPLRDMTGGFNCWRRAVLESLDLSSLNSAGYCFQIELKYRAWKNGYRHVEVPILFPDRRLGTSKMTRKIVLEAVWNVWKLRAGDGSGLVRQLVQFGLVGAMGTLTNLLIFFLLVDLAGLGANVGAVCAFAVAVTQNFLLNRLWTFSGGGGFFRVDGIRRYRLRELLPAYARFVAVSLGGLAVNLAVLNLLLAAFTLPLKTIANLMGVAAGMIVNFLGYRLWVFRVRRGKAAVPGKEPAAPARARLGGVS